MNYDEIIKLLEDAYNEEDWSIIEQLIEDLQYTVDSNVDGELYPWHDEDGHDEID
jgi:dihydroneopterin aldolase|tara:strand:+ start:507 stop:671 length:165 start_codon:yes stop_codon:yes gene_type:complete